MRSTTRFAHMMRACILALALMALPQLASAQLPLETKSLKIQATSGTAAVTLTATGTTGYNLNLPNGGAPGAGGFLFALNTDGGLAWTNTPTAAGWSLRWSGSAIEWVDPTGANNPNWSLTGNSLTGAGKLGTITAQDVNFITTNLTRMTIEGDGDVLIATDATNGGDVTIGNNNAVTVNGATIALAGATSTTINATAGTTSINATSGAGAVAIGNAATAALDLKAVATTIVGASLGITGATTQTGVLNLAGENSALQMKGQPGTSGDVLVSAGAGTTPTWKSLNDATGIKAKGKVAIAQDGTLSQQISGISGMDAGDAVLITLQSTSGVYAVVTATADGSFTVQYTGAATGSLTYLVLDTTN